MLYRHSPVGQRPALSIRSPRIKSRIAALCSAAASSPFVRLAEELCKCGNSVLRSLAFDATWQDADASFHLTPSVWTLYLFVMCYCVFVIWLWLLNYDTESESPRLFLLNWFYFWIYYSIDLIVYGCIFVYRLIELEMKDSTAVCSLMDNHVILN